MDFDALQAWAIRRFKVEFPVQIKKWSFVINFVVLEFLST